MPSNSTVIFNKRRKKESTVQIRGKKSKTVDWWFEGGGACSCLGMMAYPIVLLLI